MARQYKSFWTTVGTAQSLAQRGDTAGAIRALLAARETAGQGMDQAAAKRRHAFIDRLLSAIRAPSTGAGTAGGESRKPRQRILVSGIGRSGTTLIYQQIAKLLLLDSRLVNFRYEPYLWNIHTPQTEGNPFDMSQLHNFGLMVHTRVPLFLDGENECHDPFIDHLFNEKWDQDPSISPDTYLTKVIRGSGRLRSYLKRYPDLKIVACLRNPIDTINSSLGMFSFFGEEFHPDDRLRFRAEVEARGGDISKLETPDLRIEWYAQWVQAFTAETLAVAQDYPGNVFSFCYEAFQETPDAIFEALMDFLGIRNIGMFMGLNKPAGPSIKATSLTRHDIHALMPQIQAYSDKVMVPHIGPEAAAARTNKILSRYTGGRFSFPIAGSEMGRKSPIQLRGQILNKGTTPFLQLVQHPAHPVDLAKQIEQHNTAENAALYQPVQDVEAIKKGKRFGAVVTCHNNADTIVDAVLSCLNQTLPFDEIVIVNDKSSDSSQAILGELEARYSSVKVLNLESNLGPSAARDLGIRRLTTEFFTQLDGDDLFWPTKNAQEAATVAGDESIVAFSDILLVQPGKSFIQSTGAYDGKIGTEAWQALLARTVQIPRDMTVARRLYFDAGGYDMTRHIYEDWDLKLRLAGKSRLWRRAAGTAGTIYNRISPGLSGVEDEQHALALSQIFLSALDHVPELRHDTLLSSFDAALGRMAAQHVAVQTRHALETCLSKGGNLSRLSSFAAQRHTRAMDNTRFAAAIEAFVKQTGKLEVLA